MPQPFFINNLDSNFINPKHARIWKNPTFSEKITNHIESQINKPNKYGFRRFYSHIFSSHEGPLSLVDLRNIVLVDDSKCVFFADHQVARRISELPNVRADDEHSRLARAMIALAPVMRAKIDIYTSVLEQSGKGLPHKPYITSTFDALSYSIEDISSGLMGRYPKDAPDPENFRRIILRNPQTVYADDYQVDLCHVLKIVQLFRDKSLRPAKKVRAYLEWQAGYFINPIATVLALGVFKEKPMPSVWADLADSFTDDDERFVANQVIDLQYSHRYSSISRNCEASGIIPVVFSNDASLLLLLECVSCGTKPGDGTKKIAALIDFFYGKQSKPEIQAAFRRFEIKTITHPDFVSSAEWPKIKEDTERMMLDWWEQQTGRPFRSIGMP